MNADGTCQRRLSSYYGPAGRPAWCCSSSPCPEEFLPPEYIPATTSPKTSPVEIAKDIQSKQLEPLFGEKTKEMIQLPVKKNQLWRIIKGELYSTS